MEVFLQLPDLDLLLFFLLFKPGDYEDLAGRIVEILSNTDLQQRLGQGAINFVPRFSAANIAKQWVKLYSEVIEKYNK